MRHCRDAMLRLKQLEFGALTLPELHSDWNGRKPLESNLTFESSADDNSVFLPRWFK